MVGISWNDEISGVEILLKQDS